MDGLGSGGLLGNTPNDNTMLSIHTMLARQDQTLNNMNQDMREIRDDIKGIRMEMKDYMPKNEADIQFKSLAASITALQLQIADVQQWRMASSVATVREINAVQAGNKQDVSGVKEQGFAQLLSKQGAILGFVFLFLLWLVEQFIVNSHILGK